MAVRIPVIIISCAYFKNYLVRYAVNNNKDIIVPETISIFLHATYD